MEYPMLHTLHVLGVVLFLGNLVVTAIWKSLADRSGEPRTIAFAQRLVAFTDRVLTGPGAVLILLTGIRMMMFRGEDPREVAWLAWGLGLFVVSGVIWAGILIPIQNRQSRLAGEFAESQPIPEAYRQLSRRWMIWGGLATLLPLLNLALMIVKPV